VGLAGVVAASAENAERENDGENQGDRAFHVCASFNEREITQEEMNERERKKKERRLPACAPCAFNAAGRAGLRSIA